MFRIGYVLAGFLIAIVVHLSCTTDQAPTSIKEEINISNDLEWLEDLKSERVDSWVAQENALTLKRLTNDPLYPEFFSNYRDLLTAEDRIPYSMVLGTFAYNFHQDKTHVRGIWRRISLKEFLANSTNWEIVLDIDKLAATENESWNWGTWLYPMCNAPTYDRCMISLTHGGGDIHIMREFDLVTKQFVKDGFQIPEGRSIPNWIDRDTLFLIAPWGEDSLTTSKNLRQVRIWRRGVPFEQAEFVFEGQKDDLRAIGHKYSHQGQSHLLVERKISIEKSEFFYYQDCEGVSDNSCQKLTKLPWPIDVGYIDSSWIINFAFGQFILVLKSDWQQGNKLFKAGSVISFSSAQNFSVAELVYEPNERSAVRYVSVSRDYLTMNVMENIQTKILAFSRVEQKWHFHTVENLPFGDGGISFSHPEASEIFLGFESFLTPPSLYALDRKNPNQLKLTKIRSKDSNFTESQFETQQLFASSKDGTQVPYFIVYKKVSSLTVLIQLYCGDMGPIKVRKHPFYLANYGKTWLERGGIFVNANIRGGGEFGPKWAEAGKREKKQNVFDDFIAVAEDIIKRGYTVPRYLASMGASAGGYLVGATAMQRPDLFRAAIAIVPVLDLLRFHLFLSGPAWKDEFGDPDNPDMKNILLRYSPLHNVKAGIQYPEFLLLTNTKDDRLHPNHARKMAGKLKAMGQRYSFYEDQEGGHGGSVDIESEAKLRAMRMVFLWQTLK